MFCDTLKITTLEKLKFRSISHINKNYLITLIPVEFFDHLISIFNTMRKTKVIFLWLLCSIFVCRLEKRRIKRSISLCHRRYQRCGEDGVRSDCNNTYTPSKTPNPETFSGSVLWPETTVLTVFLTVYRRRFGDTIR